MSHTIAALFDDRADAQSAEASLKAANVHADNVRIHDKSSTGFKDTGSTHADTGIWGSVKNAFLPDEDRHTYEEGVRRGGFLLTADVDEHSVDAAVGVLESAKTVDIDVRAQQWRSSGWDATPKAMPAMGATSGTTAGDDVIQIVEEQLVVGKREVSRGGVRVRTYVTETPVHEQIRLRQETVKVERRPVDRAVTGDDAFQERTIEMRETAEEAVVGKKQRVVEEVVVSKTADETTQEIEDTVRRTDVEIDDSKTDIRTDR